MILKKIKSKGIAHNSYFIGSADEAAVIDPRRDCKIYAEKAQQNEMKIKYIFETHRNEDYTIGSLELSSLTGAEIFHGSKLRFNYGKTVNEKDKFDLGLLKFKILETPGHTDESISITINEKNSNDAIMVFTGDLIFAGDTGRIDLYGEKEKKQMAEKLYESLHKKILTLEDGVIICPAHGKGSVCGAEISDLEYTTIGYEKENNNQLKLKKEEFVDFKINEDHYIPPYFKQMERYNQNGAPIIYNLPILIPISVQEIKKMDNKKIELVDIRSPTSYASGHVSGSLNIWRKGIPLFAGWFLNYDKKIILIDDFNLDLEKAVRDFIRIGYDNIYGYLEGGFSSWFKENEQFGKIKAWTVADLKNKLDDDSIYILDVREKSDRKKQGHIKNSTNIFVGNLPSYISKIPNNKNIVIYCDSGFKTSIAASILKKNGYFDITNVLGGFIAWKKAGYEIEK